MPITTLRHTLILVTAGLCMAMFNAANAAEYPTRPVTAIVPYPAGGSADLAARALAEELKTFLGKNVVVDNRSGGGGSVGNAAVARARADGYTLGVAPLGSIVNQPHMHRVPYTLDSFDYICRFYYVPDVMVVNPESPFQDLDALVQYAKAHPGELTFGSPGPGTLPHLAMEQFAQVADIKMTHVPFSGDNPALTALMGGHIDAYIATPNTVRDRGFRALAVFSDEQQEALPDTRTALEQGYQMTAWISGGLIAPKGLPADVKARLVKGCETATGSAHMKEVLARIGFEPRYLDPTGYRQEVQQADQVNGKLIDKVIKNPAGQ
ncbi:tripartite tricarboxylate transporter substrate binding protein [Alloalcanivorax mobilis]|uniref:tripartite tricarboxylate transporter substrate binding protein n=1 Tax=Alloalcanivorax mobilis TaxID=2019569 RepID=UPI000C7820FC|nr:tripartite tricarboxylate transporter substrate binding protein [Alloalcanivorax mobilis]